MGGNIIRVIDFETSAIEPPEARVIEVGTCDLIGDATGWTIADPVSRLCGGVTSIDPGARAAHHISVRDLATFGPFEARDLRAQIEEDGVVVIAAHNAEFETKFFEPPVPMICTYKCALRVWPHAPSHSNGALRYWLQDQSIIDPEHDKTMPAHRAGPDAYVTAHLLKALMVTITAKQMVAWTKEPRLLPKCPIGKFRGKPWTEVDGGFLQWMLNQADMEADLKWNANLELQRSKGKQPMTIRYHADLIQGSEEWMQARLGLLTASEMKLIITPTLKIASNDKSRAHDFELLAQRITRYVEPAYISNDMLRGMQDEIDARDLYAKTYAPVETVGFITNDKWGFTIGYSPDGLVGSDGAIECKGRRQKFQIETIISGEMPDDYAIQVQTGLLVSERKWLDFVSFSGGLPMVTIRVMPDPAIQDAIIAAAAAFERRLAENMAAFGDALGAKDARLIQTERRIVQEMYA